MGRVGFIAAIAVLASCQSQETDNGSDPAATQNSDLPGETNAPAEANLAAAPPAASANISAAIGPLGPCMMQGSDRLDVRPIRATGTEPFWSARVEGRCVTYSTPEDQQGTRAWTRYSPAPSGGGAWVGQLGGKRFELTTRAEPACSDGMSDKVYPIAVELTVSGEQRRGCAEPA